MNDLFAFLAAWFAQNGSSPAVPSADMALNGQVSVNDLIVLLSEWFRDGGQL